MTNVYDWLLFLHLFGAMIWVGGAVVLYVLVSRFLRQGQPEAVAQFTRNLTVVSTRVFVPSILVLLGTGIWMVIERFEFKQLWIQISVTLFIVAVLVDALHLGRTAMAARRAAGAGDDIEAGRQLYRWMWSYRLILLLLVVTTWAMVFKPGL